MRFDGDHPASEQTGASPRGVLVRSWYDDVAVWVPLSSEFAARAIKLHQIASAFLPLALPHTSVARGSARARARETQTRTRTIAEFAEALRERGRRGAREKGARGNGRAETRGVGASENWAEKTRAAAVRSQESRSLARARACARACRGLPRGQAGRAGARGTQPPPRAAAAGWARGGSCERTGRGGAADLLEPGRSARRAAARGVRTPSRERAGAAAAAAGGGCGGDVGPPAGSAAPVRCSPAGRTARDAARRCVAARAPRCCARATALREARAWRAAVGVSLVEAAGWAPVKKKKKNDARARDGCGWRGEWHEGW